ncbi:hypothetical protein [Pseudoalteromonas sp. NZS100]|uniref:hypothetical protein n=1 Tax=Pseudoalteromonas sp. NZS100 TaxID=2792046 RepID=UPI0018CF5BF0|nr:hypothetical protein [Pseudoalteromonas sp. NZS100]MBH0066949.1 hypothetical protein [Pseudoalteromonas sp. NZS100]
MKKLTIVMTTALFSSVLHANTMYDGIYYCKESASTAVGIGVNGESVIELDLMTLTVKLKNGKLTIKDGEIFHPISKKKMSYEYEIVDGGNSGRITILSYTDSGFFAHSMNQNFSLKKQGSKLSFSQYNGYAYKVPKGKSYMNRVAQVSSGKCEKW